MLTAAYEGAMIAVSPMGRDPALAGTQAFAPAWHISIGDTVFGVNDGDRTRA